LRSSFTSARRRSVLLQTKPETGRDATGPQRDSASVSI
jgi:hypothetical protein